MSYGIEIRNKNNSLVIEKGETPLQYWGKIRHKFAYPNQRINLFNIPSHFACTIYSVSVGISDHSCVELELVNGIWHAKTEPWTRDCLVDVYVFVQSTALPKTKYGIEIYENNQLIFRGSRPLLNAHSIHNAWVSRDIEKKSKSRPINTGGKVAVNSQKIWEKVQYIGGEGFMMYYAITAMYSRGKTVHGVKRINTYDFGAWWSFGTASNRNYAAIDAAYYDKFPSLPNYS